MLLKEVKNKKFTDFTVNRCKIEDCNGKIRTIGFKVYLNNYGKYVFEVNKEDEQYCVI